MKLVTNIITIDKKIISKSGVYKFLDGDDQKQLNRNKKRCIKNWRYHTEEVNYTLNSQRYRCPEFSNISWHESILFFGCSHMFGTGVDDSHTVPAYVEKETGIPCINLGMPGSSSMDQIYNAEILSNHNINPRGVVILYPQSTRYTVFHSESNTIIPKHFGPWSFNSKDQGNFYRTLTSSDTHLVKMAKWNQRLFKTFWNCPVFEYTDEFEESLKPNDLENLLIPKDKARDLSHDGPETNKGGAETIVKDMKTRGFL